MAKQSSPENLFHTTLPVIPRSPSAGNRADSVGATRETAAENVLQHPFAARTASRRGQIGDSAQQNGDEPEAHGSGPRLSLTILGLEADDGRIGMMISGVRELARPCNFSIASTTLLPALSCFSLVAQCQLRCRDAPDLIIALALRDRTTVVDLGATSSAFASLELEHGKPVRLALAEDEQMLGTALAVTRAAIAARRSDMKGYNLR